MPHILAGVLALLQLLSPVLTRQRLTENLRSGQWLRFHVIAQDDSAPMQHVKLCVRDAVQAAYAAACPEAASSMLSAASALLPELTQAATDAARAEGFTGEVAVTLDVLPFDERTLCGARIPAGEYPALVIRLGDGQGRNWWGLLDPETALQFADAGETEDGTLQWDWSWEALLEALRRWLSQGG